LKRIKLILNKCEIDDCVITECLHLHHIIPRTDPNTSNDNLNLCILCPNHHNFVHKNLLRIIGVYPSTKLPNYRTLVYELDGKKNIDIDEPYVQIQAKSFKIYGSNT
jgi:uncharacterized membrane protein